MRERAARTRQTDDARETLAERLAADLRRNPAAYPDVATLARAAELDEAALTALIIERFHVTPAALSDRARIAALATRLLTTGDTLDTLAVAVGWPDAATATAAFTAALALTPEAYRALPRGDGFTLHLPADYPLATMLAYLGRDRHSATERVTETSFTVAAPLPGGAVVVEIAFADGAARCQVVAGQVADATEWAALHRRILGALGLTGDPRAFEARVSQSPELAPLIAGQRGLRLPQAIDPFSGLVWAIIGQQITVAFATQLRRCLVERVSAPLALGLWSPPTAEAIASLEPADLTALSFSRSKADYLIGAARLVATGALPLDAMADWTAPRVERALLATRGIGPWSAHYVMMRALGFQDCVPLGDTGLTAGLRRFFALTERPGPQATLALMERFRPYRSLATAHFWRRPGSAE